MATPNGLTGEQVKGGRALWGGAFESDPAPLMAQINASIGFDKRLAAHDPPGSRAHARMLAATGVIAEAECAAILDGWTQIEAAITAGTFEFTPELEDIHFNIEQRLTDRRRAWATAAHRLLAQRPGSDRLQAVGPRRHGPGRRGHATCNESCWRWRGSTRPR